jgi:choline dehydrogenase-like flavoprotein
MACLGGCRLDSKQSMIVTFLREALESGLELRSEFMVDSVVAGGGKVTVRGMSKEGRAEVTGRRLVLAAGVFGNVQLLLRSGFGASLPALGRKFACHPQTMHFGLFKDPVDSHKGAFQSVKSKDPGLRRRGFKLENVFAPPIAIALLIAGWGREHQRTMKRYRNMACIEVAVRDENTGTLRVARSGRLQIEKLLTDRDKARREDGKETVDQIMRSAGAEEVIHSKFRFGLHLMGGCVMGTDPVRSVVNEEFALHTHPDVFIADTSVFPNAPGINPSLTVMALSHRASVRILKEAT